MKDKKIKVFIMNNEYLLNLVYLFTLSLVDVVLSMTIRYYIFIKQMYTHYIYIMSMRNLNVTLM